jgi:hypothetical protein
VVSAWIHSRRRFHRHLHCTFIVGRPILVEKGRNQSLQENEERGSEVAP